MNAVETHLAGKLANLANSVKLVITLTEYFRIELSLFYGEQSVNIRELVSDAEVGLEEERGSDTFEPALTDDGLAICTISHFTVGLADIKQ